MALFDLPPDELRGYTPDLPEPADFDDFWAATLADARSHELDPRFEAVDTGLRLIETFDVSFAGFGGTRVRGWLHVPAGATGPLPTIVQYIGYGGGRGLAHEKLLLAAAGYASLVMDTRGQGSSGSVGHTPDLDSVGAPSQRGFMTQGILDPADYFYRRVYTDGVRAVEAARSHPLVDAERVGISGGSQGGGITLAVSALADGLVAVAPDVPFLCDFPRATTLVDTEPYAEIGRYLSVHRDHVEQAARTLSYFDGAVLARRATAPALFSVALMDTICPPSTVYAAYNHYAGPKEIIEYPFNGHEGGGAFHDRARLEWLSRTMPAGRT